MLSRLVDLGTRHSRRVLGAGAALLLVAGALGGPAQGVLKARNDFEDPGSQAARQRSLIESVTGAEPAAGVFALVSAPASSARAASVRATLAAVPAVAIAGRPVSSTDGRSAIVPVRLRARVQPNDAVEAIEARLAGRAGAALGGADVAQHAVSTQVSTDLGFAEALVFPLLAILAFLFFRGIAALLPLGVGGLTILVTFTLLRLINVALPLSIFALNLVIGLGLGLAVDYSLFIVSRFREELTAGAAIPAAIPAALATTMATAGRTVVFSALTVAAAVASLAVFPLRFLQSMAIGGAIVALVAAAVALVFLPAALTVLGPRIGTHRLPAEGEGRWYAVAHAVMRRPGAVAVATAVAMIAVALPALGTRWAGVDASVLPAGNSARVVAAQAASEFRANPAPMILAITAPPTEASAVRAYRDRLARVPGVVAATPARYLGATLWQVDLTTLAAGISPAGQATLAAVRAVHTPLTVAVGGDAAQFHDRQAAIADRLPLGIALLVVTTLLILWVMTGSVVLPVKALVMNTLTVGVSTGCLVLVFQDGRLQDLLAYRSQGAIESTDFLVLVTVSFALSTDYGVFLLTRIKEARDRGLANREAVAVGVQRTGAIVTAAAILLAVAIGAFATGKIIFIKELGLGAVVAVLVDAFVVRTLLVPSLMALLGEWNWWQPARLGAVHARFGRLTAETAPAGALRR